MTDWHNVLPAVMSTLGTDPASISCILEFLKILPEEVTEGRKFNLSVRTVSTAHHPALLVGSAPLSPPYPASAFRFAVTV
jgi:hypothetical protein